MNLLDQNTTANLYSRLNGRRPFSFDHILSCFLISQQRLPWLEITLVLVSGFGDLFAGYGYQFLCYAPQILVMHPFFRNAPAKYCQHIMTNGCITKNGWVHYEKNGHITKKLILVTCKVPRNPKQEPLLFPTSRLPWRSQQNLLTRALQYFVARRKGRPIVDLLWSVRQLHQPWFSPHIWTLCKQRELRCKISVQRWPCWPIPISSNPG